MGNPLSTSPCWAPGWVGSTPDEIISYLMATPKSSKRSYSYSESDSETQQSSFPHFIVLESLEDKPMSKLSPFVIEKTFSGLFTLVSVKKLGNGTLLVEVNKKPYADIILKIKSFGGVKIKAFAHLSLNTSKDVVRSSELSLCTLDELKSHLANQGVTDIKRISIKQNEETINTITYILAFNKSSLPKELKVGYNLIKVSPYIPNPLRCYNCKKFGHHETKCLKSPVCKKYGESGSDHIELSCNNPIKCQGNQGRFQRLFGLDKEKEINTIKYTNNISFPEARKLIQSRNQFPTRSYAQVATPNPEPKHDHSCGLCHMILEKLINLTPENLPKFVNELKTSLSKSHQPQPSTSQLPRPQIQTAPPKEVSPRLNPPQETQSPRSTVR